MRKLRDIYSQLYDRTPLNLKMLVLTAVIGVIAWGILDYVETKRLKKLFLDQLSEKLKEHAVEDRVNFDHYVSSYNDSVRIFVSQANYHNYVSSQEWTETDRFTPQFHDRPPAWFPERALLRVIRVPRYAMIIDTNGNVREIFRNQVGHVPLTLLKPDRLLLAKSHEQSLMTMIEGAPYLLTSATHFIGNGKRHCGLLFVTPIDEQFLVEAHGETDEERLVALLTPDDNSVVLSSNNHELLPPGISIDELSRNYLLTGKEFFDYGASELQTRLASFVSKKDVDQLTGAVIRSARQERALSALVFIGTFALIMYWVSDRIRKLTGKIIRFSEKTLGMKSKERADGDELHILGNSFQQMADELKISQAQLIQSGKMSAMGRLAGGLAHELNSPLAGLLPMIEKYKDREKEGSDEHYELTMMLKACMHMATILKDFGMFSRRSGGQRSELNIHDVIDDTLSFSAGLLKGRIILIREFASNVPLICGNKTELQQVVLNLLSNARDAMPDGGSLTIRTSRLKGGDGVVLEFIDDGTGINNEDIDKLFDPFFTTKGEGRGTGLGLSVSYGIVTNHGGTIDVSSEAGEGTRFKIELPSVAREKKCE